jgi:hypothetical protein
MSLNLLSAPQPVVTPLNLSAPTPPAEPTEGEKLASDLKVAQDNPALDPNMRLLLKSVQYLVLNDKKSAARGTKKTAADGSPAPASTRNPTINQFFARLYASSDSALAAFVPLTSLETVLNDAERATLNKTTDVGERRLKTGNAIWKALVAILKTDPKMDSDQAKSAHKIKLFVTGLKDAAKIAKTPALPVASLPVMPVASGNSVPLFTVPVPTFMPATPTV